MTTLQRTLEIVGIDKRIVPNTLWRNATQPATHLVLIYPGWAYPGMAPALYFTRMQALAIGADVLVIDYGYNNLEAYRVMSNSEQDAWFAREVDAAFAAGSDAGEYSRMTLVGKSLGTQAVGQLLDSARTDAALDAILLTPTLDDDILRRQLAAAKHRCLTVIGTRDPCYSAENLEITRRLGETIVVEGADHSLDVDGTAAASIDALAHVMQSLERFLRAPR